MRVLLQYAYYGINTNILLSVLINRMHIALRLGRGNSLWKLRMCYIYWLEFFILRGTANLLNDF